VDSWTISKCPPETASTRGVPLRSYSQCIPNDCPSGQVHLSKAFVDCNGVSVVMIAVAACRTSELGEPRVGSIRLWLRQMPEKNNGVEKNCVANQVVLKSKELASLTLTCLTLTDVRESRGPHKPYRTFTKEGQENRAGGLSRASTQNSTGDETCDFLWKLSAFSLHQIKHNRGSKFGR
jgi:hypothetical protein